MSKENCFSALWAFVLNLRRRFVPIELQMYRRMARNLVDEKEWYMIPLFSGMQTPLMDAVEYLAKIDDKQSIPRLKALLEEYYTFKKTKPDSFGFGGGMVTVFYGPMDYMPERIQTCIVKALISLMGKDEKRNFASEMLLPDHIVKLNDDSICCLGMVVGEAYAGAGFWCSDFRQAALLAIPDDHQLLQHGYRKNSQGKVLEYFLIHAPKEQCFLVKEGERFAYKYGVEATMIRKSGDHVDALPLEYTLHEDGSGHVFLEELNCPLSFPVGAVPRIEFVGNAA